MHISLNKKQTKTMEESERDSVREIMESMNNGTLPEGTKRQIKIQTERSNNPDDDELWGCSVESFRDLEQEASDEPDFLWKLRSGENTYKENYVEETDMSDLSIWDEFL